ncbi:MAG TPA: RidA family protein [Planctomycetes bacterium]|nr:RidA family protein [Planctomycetota bacterium]
MTSLEPVSTQDAPAAIGPYSQAVVAGDLVFCSGQIAIDPTSGELIAGGPADQARRCLENLQAVLAAAGTSLDRAVRMTVFLTDLGDFAAVNEVYATFFPGVPPARACVEVSRLPKDVAVEIDCIAAR